MVIGFLFKYNTPVVIAGKTLLKTHRETNSWNVLFLNCAVTSCYWRSCVRVWSDVDTRRRLKMCEITRNAEFQPSATSGGGETKRARATMLRPGRSWTGREAGRCRVIIAKSTGPAVRSSRPRRDDVNTSSADGHDAPSRNEWQQ